MTNVVVTETVDNNLRALKTMLECSAAVLVQGEIGCGKSLLVMHLAELKGAKEDMIQLNVDDTFDSKDLLGKYTATETPGAFEWVPGPLTLAVERGYWILMEDIDLASFDVFSVILSLLENSTLFISDKNLTITAHKDFKLIATQQLFTSGDALLTKKAAAVPYAELWGTVIMESLPSNEICAIISSLHANFPQSIAANLANLRVNNLGTPLVSLRTLLKWAARVAKVLKNSVQLNKSGAGASTAGDFLSSTVREVALKEAYDCFVAKFAPGNEHDSTLLLIASACGVPDAVAEPLVLENKPIHTVNSNSFTIGRVNLPFLSVVNGLSRDSRVAFAPTRLAMSLLERLGAAVDCREHVLLSGETGVGKTFIVQYLADQLGQTLIVHNLNQQTDTSDFMGGWKPVDVMIAVRELYNDFIALFSECFNAEKNVDFLHSLQQSMSARKWERVTKQMLKGCNTFRVKQATANFEQAVVDRWEAEEKKLQDILEIIDQTKANVAFRFEEGSLVKAWREGHWILLDELNLATNEVLERVSSVLGDVDRLFLSDRGTSEPIHRHKNFHVFANMNPPTDVGKKDLPPSLRSRFTEFYVSEPFNRNDVCIVVKEYIGFLTHDPKIDEITQFFLDCVEKAKTVLCSLDGETKPPSFSLRTLTRALSYVRKAAPLYGFLTALYDGLLLGFATPLQRRFHFIVEQLIVKNIFKNKKPPPPTLPKQPLDSNSISYEHIWVPAGEQTPFDDPSFILAESVKGHVTNLARAVFANRPVLLEGPTSSGKSSMVKYLAELTGNTFVRINNHDSTEVQEYLGHYVTDEVGKLRFVDGILVTAVRNGHWVVLDELNLAPSDVLEALNRLLDDNCELFIPDTQETIKPHPQLRIFATQNPAGIYGGRKMLSRAFRNRFLEITVDEIPTQEISFILQKRYALPESFSDRMVEVMTALQIRRQNSQIFAGKHGFITPRDLFRWAERNPRSYQELAEHGFLLLGERCRHAEERQVVKDVIETATKTELIEKEIYSPSHWPFVQEHYAKVESGLIDEFKIVWTESMQRLFTIVGICLEHKEPVLLVGETGSSKTTVCQLWAALLSIPLHILNCHQHTEAADFLGGLRPTPPDRRDAALFEWQNGPLVQSMLDGSFFVLDEISLTEDSVLERLNSVLEPSRSVTLAEKSSADCITADERFRVLATMNPGGDFGKKELSPALRNRFTEIYVRPTTDEEELTLILSQRLLPELHTWASRMAAVLRRVSVSTAGAGPQHVSIRDIISWASFMNAAHTKCPAEISFLHGLDAVILDGIGVGTGQSEASAELLRGTFLAEVSPWVGAEEQTLREPFWNVFDGMEEPRLPEEMNNRFFFGAPATQRNLSKLMRAGVMKKAVLLEGSPGVGKTSIVEALGCALSRPVVRINLSDQTDIMDLFGTYLPCPSDDSSVPQFAWSDGVLLRALKEGSWVILDELNLANQTVLEGLNALLDHRSAVFIPELNAEFHAHPDFRVFACQNPLVEGGGRKGLPKSFLNRFIKARIEAFEKEDLLCIAEAVCPDMSPDTLLRMVEFVEELQGATMVRRLFGTRGSPWEFNLRDILRWAHLMQLYDETDNPKYFAEVLFVERMRTGEDREQCRALLEHFFGEARVPPHAQNSDFLVHKGSVYFENRLLTEVGSWAPREPLQQHPLLLLPSQAQTVKSVLMCAAQSQFVLLVGPSGAGKSYVLRCAAELAGVKLMTFAMNASCDTVDLLGGFDQVEGKQGQFEWRDSLVLEAMLQGHWLVLDNVNYCSASVLDRLNPLVEPNGVLSVNEQGLVNGEIRVIKPHSNFRVFATLNPKFGEVSRAMRNRAVELYLSPVKIPSLESAVLCRGTAASEAGAELHGEDELVSKLNQYHKEFVRVAFRANASLPESIALSDALSAGAPNTFTLLRCCKMMALNSSLDGFRDALLHCYIKNRSGHWRVHREELETLLHNIVAKSIPDATYEPTLRDLSEALVLRKMGNSNSNDGDDAEVGEEGGAMSLPVALAKSRVRRSLMALAVAQRRHEAGDDAFPHCAQDLLLHLAADQCNDSVPTEYLVQRRVCAVRSLGLPLELEQQLLHVCKVQYCHASMLPELLCRALELLGPHAALLSAARAKLSSQPTNSPLVNAAASTVVRGLLEYMSNLSSPELFLDVLRVGAPLLEQMNGPDNSIHSDNYLGVTTSALLVHALLAQQLKAPFPDPQLQLAESVEHFLQTLEHHLELPFPLMGKPSVLEAYTPSPHITSLEERKAFNTWRSASRLVSSASSKEESAQERAEQLLRPLWSVGAFRAEFHISQMLLKLSTFPACIQSTTFKLSLRKSIAAFLEEYTQVLKVFTDLEVALWRSVLAIPVADYEFSIPPLVPLLTCCFLTRFPVQDVQCLFGGSWAARAVSCLQFAQQTSVLAIGNPTNDHMRALEGLSTFLSHCPVSGASPMTEMEQTSRQELLRILQACFPQVRDALQSTVPDTSLLEVIRVALGTCESKAVASQKSLITSILAALHDDTHNNMCSVMALLWSLKCRLLLPSTPVDPMLKLECEVHIATEEEKLLRRLKEAFEFANRVTLRTVDTPQRNLLEQLREREVQHLATAKEKCVHRPDPTGAQYAQLVRALYQLCSTLMSDERLRAITAAAATGDASDETMRSVQQSWSVLVYEQVVEVLHRFGGYEDVTLNFAEAALLSAFAMQANSYSGHASSAVQTLFDRPRSLELMQFPHILVDAVPLPTLTNQRHTLQSHVRYLDSCLLLLRGSCPRGTDPDFVQGLFRSYRYFYQRVEDLEAEERKAEEMAVLYKEKALVIEGDDEMMLRRLKDMFPSYEQEFAEAAATADDEEQDEKAKQKESAASAKHTRIMLKEEKNDYMQRLVAVHHRFYARLISNRTTPEKVAFDDVLDAFKLRFDVVTKDVARLANAQAAASAPGLDENLLIGGFSCRASQLKELLCAPVESLENRKESGFNIFKDPEPAEVGRFSKPLEALLDAIDRLLVQFPETNSLLRCQKIGRKIATLPALTTPLMKLMAGSEVLLRECYEWERNASSEVSLITYMTELSSFVLRWRRLELHCWSHVFQAKQNEYELNACLEWFPIYDLVRDEHDDEVTFCINLFHHLSKFLWASCFGDFHTRLRLIEGFAYELVAVHGLCAPCTNTVLHVTSFFAQYQSFVTEKCTQAIVPIEDDIKDFTKIMRWEDANYYAVRATAEKSHLKMARVLGALEEVLRTPILGCITQEEERCEEDTSMGFSLCPEGDMVRGVKAPGGGKKEKEKEKEEASSKKRARNNKKSSQKEGEASMTEEAAVAEENVLGNWKCDCVAAAYKFFASSSNEIINRVHALQQPKTTEQLKIRAFKTLLDTMTENGVPQTHEHQTATWELCFPAIEGLLGFGTVYAEQGRLPALEASTTSYYKFVRWIQRMREAERKPHADLSGAQARRGTGLVETLLSDSVSLSTAIASLFQVREKLTTLRLILEAEPSKEETDGDVSSSVEVLDHCIKLCCHTQALYGALQWMLKHKQVEMCTVEHSLLYELLTSSDQLWELCTHYEAVRRSSAYLPEEVARKCIQHLRSIYGVAGRLRTSGSPRIAAAAAMLEDRTHATLALCHADEDVDGAGAGAGGRPEKRNRTEDVSEQWLADLDAALAAAEKGFLDNTIVSSPTTVPTETSANANGDAEATEEEHAFAPSGNSGTYADYRARLGEIKLCLSEVSSSLSSLIDSANATVLLTAKKHERARRALVLYAFLEDVQDSLVAVLKEHTYFGVVVARLFTVLMKKGFCKSEDEPEEQDGDGDGGGGQQQGTGMDDGEGEKDVTDQMENEDQLMNMKDKEEQPEKDNKEKDGDESGEEEDKAADVETDFQGQKETREESEQDEEEGEGDESDKEMGSVDGEEERERKKTRKDKGDDKDMDEDDGDRADEVPEDEFGNEEDRPDEETGNFDNKEEEVRNAEEEREGDHELVGDDKDKGSMSDDEVDDSLSGDTVEQSDKEGEEKEESVVDEEQDADALEESVEKASNASDDRHDEEASTDDEKSAQGDEREVENDGPSGSDDEEADKASDAPDENVYEGGQQDDNTGNEATEHNEKEKVDAKQPDTAANEEEQAGNEQERDDAGRSWKKQQEQNLNAQRKDNTEQNRSKQHNPYKAVKEALKRHQQQIQQLNLNQHVDVDDDDDEGKDKAQDHHMKDDDDVEEFDFDENGEKEGMAAADTLPNRPTEAEEEKPASEEASNAEDSDSNDDDEQNKEDEEKAPQDVRKRRKKQIDDLNNIDEDDQGPSKKRGKQRSKLTALQDSPSEESSDADDEADEADTADDVNEKLERGRRLWQEQEAAVQGLSQQLCEQLRLILAPTLADKLQGDYKSGKRLNMKRIIPYIASQFKKDRIWLRRTKPNKRNYQIAVALDDSLSMQHNNAGVLSCRAVALIAKALQQLEVGEMGILTFGKETHIIHRLEEQFLADSGPRAFSEITFEQKSTNLKHFFETSLDYLDEGRDRLGGQTRSTTQQLQQVLFVISDGQITEDRAELRKLMARAEENNQMVVFILLDIKAEDHQADKGAPGGGAPAKLQASDLVGLSSAERLRRLKAERDERLKRVQSSSILDMQIVEFVNGKVHKKAYMEDFPFPYYVIVRELENLPAIIADAMRQFFELLNAGV